MKLEHFVILKEEKHKMTAPIVNKVITVQVVVLSRPYVHLDIIVKLDLDHLNRVRRGPLAKNWD